MSSKKKPSGRRANYGFLSDDEARSVVSDNLQANSLFNDIGYYVDELFAGNAKQTETKSRAAAAAAAAAAAVPPPPAAAPPVDDDADPADAMQLEEDADTTTTMTLPPAVDVRQLLERVSMRHLGLGVGGTDEQPPQPQQSSDMFTTLCQQMAVNPDDMDVSEAANTVRHLDTFRDYGNVCAVALGRSMLGLHPFHEARAPDAFVAFAAATLDSIVPAMYEPWLSHSLWPLGHPEQ